MYNYYLLLLTNTIVGVEAHPIVLRVTHLVHIMPKYLIPFVLTPQHYHLYQNHVHADVLNETKDPTEVSTRRRISEYLQNYSMHD